MKNKAFIYIIITGILWGTSGIFVNLLSPYGFTSLQMAAMRGTVSFIIMLVYVLMRDRSAFKIKLTDLVLFAGIGISLFGTASAYFASMQATSISTAVVLMYMAPIYVMIFSVIFLGEKLSKLKTVSVIFMLVGCCLVSGIVGGMKFDAVGILMGVISGISYASYNILTKISMQRHNSPTEATLYSFMFMSVISLSVSDPWKIITNAVQAPIRTVPLIIGIGVFTFIIPYLLYTLAMRELPAGTASSLSIVEPMAATLFSVLLFKEPLSLPSACGIILILSAVFMLSRADSTVENGCLTDRS